MEVLALVKLALDTGQLRMNESKVDIDATPLKISDIDRSAVEEAVRIKEKVGGRARVIAVLKYGPLPKRQQEAESLLREALAMGADEAYLIVDNALVNSDQLLTAKAIAATVKKLGNYDLIIAGEATIDGYTSQVGSRVAAELGIPVISFVRELRVEGNKVTAKRDLEDAIQTVEAQLPALVTVTREINVPRIPPLLQIRAAMKKPINKLSLADLGISMKSLAEIVNIAPIQVKRKGVIIKDGTVDEKVDKLTQALIQEGLITPR
ncbi:electron transfer flavoprotein subunit beta/FixA family protein [Vulcanisaeta souniana]|uniref:Electron transfer flavoprotein subunit beta n=1 Tax=Vulcanisaeta souniana JCM 11219 TaxID=1293586 RepID=A0A830EAH8_9CREN|nr:electron transfer flavoprotein subunit beta/FixA family protein [Vulcanisaeta souniana]BDR91256.1 electron transfer flavoprotein subunit beta [Vulcanisaeta souniana JCM 11219]GGI85049.1 electron transfer flavoprotein subunit beta [Vulcanisaeta souniana JCM 11219]